MRFLKCAAMAAVIFAALLVLSMIINAAYIHIGTLGIAASVFFATPLVSTIVDALIERLDTPDASQVVCLVLVLFAVFHATSCSSDVRRQSEVIDAVDAVTMACPFECEPHQVCCDTEDGVRCTDVLAEPDNCGACGVWCGVGGYCNDGVCR